MYLQTTFSTAGREYSSAVEHRIADPAVAGSIPAAPCMTFIGRVEILGCSRGPKHQDKSLWPNWTRRLTTNQKIGGSSPSRDSLFIFAKFCFGAKVLDRPKLHPRWDSNPQSSAPETDALSIWPLGHLARGALVALGTGPAPVASRVQTPRALACRYSSVGRASD